EKVNLDEVSLRLCEHVKRLGQPVVLVGHSQGGAIITEAAGHCRASIRKLIYVAAVFPKPGEGVFGDLSQADGDSYTSCGDLDESTNTYKLKDFDGCWRGFMGDLSRDAALAGYKTMVPEPASIGDSTANYSLDVVNQ